MQKTNSNMMAKTTRRRVQSSTTLNRRYVRKPGSNMTMNSSELKQPTQNIIVKHKMPAKTMSNTMQASTTDNRIKLHTNMDAEMDAEMDANTSMSKAGLIHEGVNPTVMNTSNTTPIYPTSSDTFDTSPIHSSAMKRMKRRQDRKNQMTAVQSSIPAKELKERAIQKALASASAPIDNKKERKQKAKRTGKLYFGFGRIMLALACATATAFAIVYFVDSNMPDISLKVAAMQTGINASYPGYVPRDFSISSITSEDGKITLEFKNSANGDTFSLVEESSSWDSNALMTNYVKDEFGDNYAVVKEQGITMYIDGSNAAWVNGGVVYKLNTTSGSLTNKQIKSIAVSM